MDNIVMLPKRPSLQHGKINSGRNFGKTAISRVPQNELCFLFRLCLCRKIFQRVTTDQLTAERMQRGCIEKMQSESIAPNLVWPTSVFCPQPPRTAEPTSGSKSILDGFLPLVVVHCHFNLSLQPALCAEVAWGSFLLCQHSVLTLTHLLMW